MRTPLAVLAFVTLFVSSASAQDACLTGASTLGDQRALADLRVDMETSCPCASAVSRWCRAGKFDASL